MKTALCYFSGTGNSLDIAQKMAQTITADIFYIPAIEADVLAPYSRIILISPVYLFGLPTPTKQFIATLPPDKSYHAVLHYGGFAGNAAHYTKDYFCKHGLEVLSVHTMTMPENFSLVATVPAWYVKRSLAKTQKKALAIATAIQQGAGRLPRKNLFAFLDQLHEKNAPKWTTLPQSFVIADNCNSCGHCADICPTNNIKIDEGCGPVFGGSCASCLACFHRCPRAAINYGKKTVGKPRYVNPYVDLSQMKHP